MVLFTGDKLKFLISIMTIIILYSPVISQTRFSLGQPQVIRNQSSLVQANNKPNLHYKYAAWDTISSLGKTSFSNKVIAGYGMGIVVGLGSGLVTATINKAVNNCKGQLGCIGGAAIGVVTGFIVGSALGVYWVGENEYIEGSFGWTLFGSTIGMLAYGLAPVGATIAFDYTSIKRDVFSKEITSNVYKIDIIKIYF